MGWKHDGMHIGYWLDPGENGIFLVLKTAWMVIMRTRTEAQSVPMETIDNVRRSRLTCSSSWSSEVAFDSILFTMSVENEFQDG